MTLPTIGFIGLGRMGRGMALSLVKAVDKLYVFDAQPQAMEPLIAAGADPCESPAEVATKSRLIILCLPAAPEVRDVLFGKAGIRDARQEGRTIVDTTTQDRDDALEIAREAGQAEIAYWDCPISGMPYRATDGTLTVMFGGTEEVFSDIEPYLLKIGEFVVHCGPLGTGQAMKALNNIIYNINIAGLCEILPLAVSLGLDAEQVARVVTSASSRSFASEYFVPRMLARQFEGDFSMEAAYKDIVNVQRMAIEKRASMPLANAMISTYQSALALGYGDQPKSAMLKVYEQALGVEFCKPKNGHVSVPSATADE